MNHGGQLGWWWVVGPDRDFYNEPVYPYPDLYTPYNQPIGRRYWRDPYAEYDPDVTHCPVPWELVMPQNSARWAGRCLEGSMKYAICSRAIDESGLIVYLRRKWLHRLN